MGTLCSVAVNCSLSLIKPFIRGTEIPKISLFHTEEKFTDLKPNKTVYKGVEDPQNAKIRIIDRSHSKSRSIMKTDRQDKSVCR